MTHNNGYEGITLLTRPDVRDAGRGRSELCEAEALPENMCRGEATKLCGSSYVRRSSVGKSLR
ncbi:hypothetical protein [Kocuria aegyptia]|uniref:Uncharacterized protein n=1 Tax=Kocuria aegyptia TaxID=330943 RepID=A0ABP4WIT6_9MICC